MNKLLFTMFFLFSVTSLVKAESTESKVFLIVLDGYRWQELFTGAEKNLLQTLKDDSAEILEVNKNSLKNWSDSPIKRRVELNPFVWKQIEQQGIIIGNRLKGSYMDVSNQFKISYPGYNEIITGCADDVRVQSNDEMMNPNVSVFEYLNSLPSFNGKVYVFASWNRFSGIFNYERSQLPMSIAHDFNSISDLTSNEQLIAKTQLETLKEWKDVRHDRFTFDSMMETVKNRKPRVVFLGLGEPDEYGHSGEYNRYLDSAKKSFDMIEKLWNYLQSDPFYKGQTTLIITTDHGRGLDKEWTSHGQEIKHSENAWVLLLGHQISPEKINTRGRFYSNQIAPTIAKLLGVEYVTSCVSKSLI